MTCRSSNVLTTAVMLIVAGMPVVARADRPATPGAATAAPAAPDDPKVAEARDAFVKATELAKRAQWAEALASFERSSSLRPHPVTTYNIGFCQRALGAYTLARDAFAQALHDDEAKGGGQLPEMLKTEATGYVAEIDALLSSVTVHLSPPGAIVAIDGRPLDARVVGGAPIFVAGVRPPGPGEAAPGSEFRVRLNPGLHILSFTRTGFAAAVERKTLQPGANPDLRYALDRLPATLHIASNQDNAIVTVGGVDVGAVPVDVSRPGGSYKVVVRKRGYKPFEVDAVVRPGEDLDVRANLVEDRPALTQRWWFWTGVAVVVAGAALGTYEATRPAPQRPAPVAGGLNWVVTTP